MEFKVKHDTKWIHYGIGVPWIVLIFPFLIFLFLGFDINNEIEATLFLRLLAFCAPFEILFIVLFVSEQIYGARIIIESDHIDVRMVLRRKRLYFHEIIEAKYSHYYDPKEKDSHFTSPDIGYSFGPQLRSQLIFYLNSGKVLILNDKATGYEEKRKRAMVDPRIDPDENIRLYQAYQCYCSAVELYVQKSQ